MNIGDPIPNGLVLRDIRVVSDGTILHASNIPWLVTVRVIAQGGDAVRADGQPGDNGYVLIEMYGYPEGSAEDTTHVATWTRRRSPDLLVLPPDR